MSATIIPAQLLPRAENNPELTLILTRHGETFLRMMQHRPVDFQVLNAIEFPFAHIVTGNPTISEAQKKWPELHEQHAALVDQVMHACEQWHTTRSIVGESPLVVQSMVMSALLSGYQPDMVFGCIEARHREKENWPSFRTFIKWTYQMRPY